MDTDHNALVPSWLLLKIADAETGFFQRVGGRDSLEAVEGSVRGCRYPLTMLEKLLGKEKVKTAKILEIGSGYGFFLCYALKLGLDVVGIEPGTGVGFTGRYERAVELLELNLIPDARTRLLNATAESLPFDDNSFDAVISVAVLEHVRDLDVSMNESIRVLKPGGLLWANLPNYGGIYEAHYNIFWIPYMAKWLAKKYVRMLGRDASLIDELNLVTLKTFKKYLNGGETYGKTYVYGRGRFNAVLTAYDYCINNKLIPEPSEHTGIRRRIISLLRRRDIQAVVRIPLGFCTKIAELLGLVTVFDLVLYKRSI